jgi:hypothetical protein
MTAKNILNSGGGSGSKNKTLVTLQSVLAELESWRKNKKFSSEPIPQIIKEQIYHLVTSKQYKPIQIIKQLRISSSKIKSIESDIKTYFAEKSKKELKNLKKKQKQLLNQCRQNHQIWIFSYFLLSYCQKIILLKILKTLI